jgi:hypothetical protein
MPHYYQCKAKRCRVSPCPACHNRGPCQHCHDGKRKKGCSYLTVIPVGAPKPKPQPQQHLGASK